MTGKVWLVGAGPADVGLLTLKGKQVLEQAEVVIYDALVGAGILSLIPPAAEKINAGKRSSHHLIRQEDTNRLLLDYALQGKRVVRLKGGDPFLFGRGGEELELLAEHGVPFEVVPGVSSSIAVPAYCGIPVTHRDYCSSVHIITGHRKHNTPLDIDFDALRRAGGTLVFMMGLANLEAICAGLLQAGMSPDTAAAVLQKGASAEQRAIVADLATLPEKARQEKAEMPAIIVVGEVCRLQRRFQWAEKLPLFGCRVVLTRPLERMGTLAGRLRDLGAQVIECPTICTVPISPNPALSAALSAIERYNWIAFTSPAGVDIFCDALLASGKDLRALAGSHLAAIGGGTAKALAKRGLLADLVPEIYDAAHLGQALAKTMEPGSRLLLPRARLGSPELNAALDGCAVELCDLPVYDTQFTHCETPDLCQEFTEHPQTLAVFTSASTVRGFAAAAPGLELAGLPALCIGRQTAAQAAAYGMKTEIAEKASLDALVELVIQHHKTKQN